VNGVSYPLNVPSGFTSGIKLNGDFDVTAGGVVSLQLDFDAANSIHQNGNGTYMLSPVIRMLPASSAGAIAGHIVSDGSEAEVQILNPETGDLVAGTSANTDGTFKVGVLQPGWYTVVVTSTTGRVAYLQDVYVAAGQTITFGRVSFPA
jgi:hypothetical protein